MAGALAAGIDVGGTKLAAGLVGADGVVRVRLRADTPPEGGDAVTEAIADIAARLRAEAGEDVPVGVGVAGVVDGDGALRYSPNIPGWDDVPLRARLAGRLAGTVVVENDANAAAWGEHRAGVGRTAAGGALLMLTVGTGVGGGLVQDGRLVRGTHGMAAEFGHIVLLEGGPRCGCGNLGCLEALASGTAIGREAREGLARGEASLLDESEPVTGKRVTLAAKSGDRFALEVLRGCGFWLGVGIASLVNALDPALVAVGGGAMQAGEHLLAPAREAYAARVVGRAHRELAPVVEAALGDDAGMVGAALLALAARDGAQPSSSPR